MAQTTAIRVSVLEGSYSHLQASGVPLPLCIHMQELGVMLSTAQWTARQSLGGFSVSFFWPAEHKPYLSAAPKLRKPRKRRKKKSKKTDNVTTGPSGEEGTTPSASSITAVPPVSDVNSVANDDPPSEEVDPASPNTLSAISTTTIPAASPLSDVHPVTHSPSSAEDGVSSSAESLDLNACDSVVLDIREVPGVRFVKDGISGWTPVVSKRKKDRQRKRGISPASSSSSSDCDLRLSDCEANFLRRNDMPGIAYKKRSGGSRIWTPIASRTRHRLRTTPSKVKTKLL